MLPYPCVLLNMKLTQTALSQFGTFSDEEAEKLGIRTLGASEVLYETDTVIPNKSVA